MPFEFQEFAIDLSTMSYAGLYKKYENKIPRDIDINQIVQAIHDNGLEIRIVDRDWDSKNLGLYGYYMLYNGTEYIVFFGERGIQNWQKKFTNFDDACRYKIDLVINAIGYE